ncbi:glycosyltransferase [Rhodonellum sp.]|uniref:glycosyltransferase n=1 Tax=Rhodonellum sp. TaxID=2231180 RepID=UPI00271C3BB1|nr:glycosyltransferase [Rhodonellum sp.]MDO9551127.1 glycosyltransferase [Rhodonellum sp.]
MKILIISMNVAPWGGSEELWKSIALKALKNGDEVMVSTYRHQSLNENIGALQNLGADLHFRRLPSFEKNQPFIKRGIAELSVRLGLDQTVLEWMGINRWKPEVILFSSGETFDHGLHHQFYPVKYCIQRGIPYYMISQRNWEWGLDVDDQFRDSRKQLLKGCSGIFFVSYHNYKKACMQLAMKIPRARVVQNPLKADLKQIIPYPQHEIPQLAYVARLQTAIKGQDLFLEALSSQALREIPFQVSFFGRGPDENYLQKLIRHYGLEDKVHLRGYENSIEKIWASHQLLVLCSLAEGTPLALKEAMACGRSAIITAVGDTKEWLSNDGFVAKSHRVASIEAAVLSAVNAKCQWEDLGQKCKERILRNENPNEATHILECMLGKRALEETGRDPVHYFSQL